MQSTRLSAINILDNIIHNKHSLSTIQFDHPFIQEMVYGALRWYYRLEVVLNRLLKSPLKPQDNDIHVLLLLGLYQLMYLNLPAYAIVNETVKVTLELRKAWAKKLVNAILRVFIRQKENLLATLESDVIATYAHPPWMIHHLKKAWPTYWQSVLTANNQHPPFSLRINLQATWRHDYLPGELHPYTDCGIILPHAKNIHEMADFSLGKVSVQDGAAQLAAALLDLKPGMQVLDACAAPGGKTAHILETEPQLKKLLAVDIDEKRLQRVSDNIARIEIALPAPQPRNDKVVYIKGNAATPAEWWGGEPFDRILCDAPCSSTGVIRRHPDIKLLRRDTDIKKFAEKQFTILTALWPLLKVQGLLVYATCSIFPEENTKVIQRFLATHPDAKEKIIAAAWGIAQTHGRQILPGMDNMDGFYYACLEKIANACANQAV